MGAPGRTALLATSSLCLWLCARAHRDEEQLLDLEGLVANLERGGGELEEEEARTASTEGPEDHLTFDDIVRSWPNCTITTTFLYNGTDDEFDEFRNLRTNTLPLIGSLLKPLLVDRLAEANIVIGEEFAPEGLFVVEFTANTTRLFLPGTNCSHYSHWLNEDLMLPTIRYLSCEAPIQTHVTDFILTSSSTSNCEALFYLHCRGDLHETDQDPSFETDQDGHCVKHCATNMSRIAWTFCANCTVFTTADLSSVEPDDDKVIFTQGQPDENYTTVQIFDRNCSTLALMHGQNSGAELNNAVSKALCGSVEFVAYEYVYDQEHCNHIFQDVDDTECPTCCPQKEAFWYERRKHCALRCRFEDC